MGTMPLSDSGVLQSGEITLADPSGVALPVVVARHGTQMRTG